MILSHSNFTLRVRVRTAVCGCDEQALVQCFEIESAIEVITKGSQVSAGVLSKGKRRVTTGETGLEVSERDLVLRSTPGLATASLAAKIRIIDLHP
jgi:hypothetical protein